MSACQRPLLRCLLPSVLLVLAVPAVRAHEAPKPPALRFSADDEDYSQQRYCSWTVAGLSLEPVPSSSGAVLQVEAIADQLDLALFHVGLDVHAGLAGGANIVLIPEQPFDVEEVCRLVKGRFQRGDGRLPA